MCVWLPCSNQTLKLLGVLPQVSLQLLPLLLLLRAAPTCRQLTQVDSTDLVLSDDLRSHLIMFFSSILFYTRTAGEKKWFMLVYNHTFLLVFTCLFSNGPGEEKPGMSHDFPTNFPRVLAWLFYLGLVNPWEMEERNAHLQIYMGKSSRNDMDFPAKKSSTSNSG